MSNLIPTGNEHLCLPTIRNESAAVESLNLILMQLDGLLEICGRPGEPLLTCCSAARQTGAWTWRLRENWIPEFAHRDNPSLRGIILVPPGERFMVYRAPQLDAQPTFTLSIGEVFQTANIRHRLPNLTCVVDGFNWGYKPGLMINIFAGTLLASLAVRCPGEAIYEFEDENGRRGFGDGRPAVTTAGSFRIHVSCREEPTLLLGAGLSSVGAMSATLEAHRVAPDEWLNRSEAWLRRRRIEIPGDAALELKANRNAHFARFFAMGNALDTGETVSMTSRSHRYYVSSAYWDRDSLLWLFPLLVRNDPSHARALLQYAFGRQLREAGIHSRYISGRILEYGFELDELVAPLVALGGWLSLHPKDGFWDNADIQQGVLSLIKRLHERRHSRVALYSTELMPTDDLVLEGRGYLTYNNALVIHALKGILPVLGRIDRKTAAWARAEIKLISRAIRKHLVRNGMFLWATNLDGSAEFYDEAAGSLVLLPYLGFCHRSDPIYRKTLKRLYSPTYPYYRQGPFAELGNRHTGSPHPWVLSACSSVLSGARVKEGLDFLRRAPMDDGIACESVHIQTGEPISGLHFATCAGYVAYAIMTGVRKTPSSANPRTG